MHPSDGLDRLVEAVAGLSAVSKDLLVLQPADRMLDPRTVPPMFRAVGLLTGQQGPAGSFAVRDDQAGADVGAVAEHGDALALVRQTRPNKSAHNAPRMQGKRPDRSLLQHALVGLRYRRDESSAFQHRQITVVVQPRGHAVDTRPGARWHLPECL